MRMTRSQYNRMLSEGKIEYKKSGKQAKQERKEAPRPEKLQAVRQLRKRNIRQIIAGTVCERVGKHLGIMDADGMPNAKYDELVRALKGMDNAQG